MNLVFNEYIQFLKDKGVDINKYSLKEGYYWLDRQIIKAYDIQGNLHKILRLIINDDLSIEVKQYKEEQFEIESWQNTIERNKEKLKQLHNKSKELIKNSIDKHKELVPTILSSGGKDSSIVTYIVREVYPAAQIIFNNTSLDCADTYLHIKSEDNIRIINPKEGFYQWREKYNFVPTRFSRACCTIFKEGAMVETLNKDDKYLFFMGMRNQESSTRSGYGDEWKNEKWGIREWQGVLPIREWSEEDVWLFMLWKSVNINPKYKKGYSRVGCAVACPYYNKSTWVLDQYWYPKMYDRWQNILVNDFNNNNKALIMNCTLDEYKLNWNGGIVREEPTSEVIEEFAEKNELDVEVAKKYFSHSCEECSKKIKSKEVLAMNMKFNGRISNKFWCKKHLKERLSINDEQWNTYVEEFKNQGCSLF